MRNIAVMYVQLNTATLTKNAFFKTNEIPQSFRIPMEYVDRKRMAHHSSAPFVKNDSLILMMCPYFFCKTK